MNIKTLTNCDTPIKCVYLHKHDGDNDVPKEAQGNEFITCISGHRVSAHLLQFEEKYSIAVRISQRSAMFISHGWSLLYKKRSNCVLYAITVFLGTVSTHICLSLYLTNTVIAFFTKLLRLSGTVLIYRVYCSIFVYVFQVVIWLI